MQDTFNVTEFNYISVCLECQMLLQAFTAAHLHLHIMQVYENVNFIEIQLSNFVLKCPFIFKSKFYQITSRALTWLDKSAAHKVRHSEWHRHTRQGDYGCYFWGQRHTSYLLCRWEWVEIRKNALSVGVLGSRINHGLSDQFSLLLESRALPYMFCHHFCNRELS